MKIKRGRISGDGNKDEDALPPQFGDDSTETIDFTSLGLDKLTMSGSYSVPGVSSTAVGKLLEAIPLPALLLDDSLCVLFLNSAWEKLGSGYRELEGWPGYSLFPSTEAANKARELMDDVLANRKPLVAEGMLQLGTGTMWGRIHFRSLRMAGSRFVLMMVEDLTPQKKQLSLRKKLEDQLRRSNTEMEELVQRRTADLSKTNQSLRDEIVERKRVQKMLSVSLKKLEDTLMGTVVALASMTEKKDPYTAGHQRRVAELAYAIAMKMALSRNQSSAIRIAAALHDIGKIYVPAEFLAKPGEISGLEREIIREHPKVGHDILSEVDFMWPVAEIVYQHHERLDGSGYPRGLQGEDVVLEARIIAVADVVEAMSSHRPYRKALGPSEALIEIKTNAGTLYDGHAVNACLTLFEEGFAFSDDRVSL